MVGAEDVGDEHHAEAAVGTFGREERGEEFFGGFLSSQ